jgi:hypothetical protein
LAEEKYTLIYELAEDKTQDLAEVSTRNEFLFFRKSVELRQFESR